MQSKGCNPTFQGCNLLLTCRSSRSNALSGRKPSFRKCFGMCDRCMAGGWKHGALAGLFHISQEPYETPANFYTRAFLLPLRFPCLTTLGLPPPDIFANERAVRQELLRVPLPQALDFLHSRILAILCVNAPRRPKGSQKIHSIDPCPPTACYLVFPERATAGVPDPPQFRCWISRRVAPNMAVIGLKCNSTPWACSYNQGRILRPHFSCALGYPK